MQFISFKAPGHMITEELYQYTRDLLASGVYTNKEVAELTGHAVGGVCPFAVNEGVQVYLDLSLRRFDTVFPAAGSSNSAIELTCDELARYSNSLGWVDVCKGWQSEDN